VTLICGALEEHLITYFAVICAKMSEMVKMAMEMPFGLWTWIGPRNHVFDGGGDPPMGRGNF